MKMEMEKRIYQTKLEIRTDPETKKRYVDGLIKVDSPSVDLGGFIEVIKPGAFDPILKDDVRGLINHDPNLIIGRTKNGTMQMRVNGEGHLAYSIELPNTTIASSLSPVSKDHCSFWYIFRAVKCRKSHPADSGVTCRY